MSKYDESSARNIPNMDKGRFGSVKLVTRNWDQKQVVRKPITYNTANPKEKRNAENEYRTQRCFDHPNIARYTDAEWLDGEARFYMDYFDSGSQARSLLKEGEDEEDYDSRRPSTEEIWAMVYQLSAAVAYCYDPNKQLGIMEDNDINEGDRNRARSSVVYHRDIKPQNILVAGKAESSLEKLKLCDFGVSFTLDGSKDPTTDAGTDTYMPPEIKNHFTGKPNEWTKKCDIYSLGCTFYAMCQGKPPSNHHTESKESADKFNTIHDSYTDEELRKIIKDCLKYDPSGRLEAAELLEIAKTKLEQIKDSPYQSALIDIRYSEALKGDSMKNLKSIIEKNKEHFNPKSDYKGMYTPLHKAFQYRNLYAVDLLLNKDFSLLDEAEGRVTPLHLAFEWIKELNERILELEIRKNKVERDSPDSDTERLKSDITASKGLNCSLSGRLVDASQKNKTIWKKKYGGWTLLHSAAAANCVTIVKSVLKNEPGWNLCTDTNWTLVHIAARNSYMELLKMLLSRKTDIEKVSKNEGTPLFAASKYGRMDAVSLLLQEGANVNVFPMVLREDKKAKMTALHVAALGGHAAVVKVLLGDKNINIVNKRTDKGETALHLAVMNSHKSCDEVISTLVESKKLNIEEKANLTVNGRVDEYTPLHIAVETCNVHGVRKLLYCRADPNSKTKNENTSLHLAARNGFKAIAQILLEEVPPNTIQADPNKLNRARNTPLHEAIENDVGMKENDDKRKAMNEIAELLIKHNKTRCSEINKTGETALHIAARNNIFKLFKIAYPYCKEAINLKTYKDKETALHVAARLDRLKIVKFLCDHQDNVVIEAKDARGRTPLQVATGSAKKELIQRFGQ